MKIEKAIEVLLTSDHPKFKGRKMSKYQIANILSVNSSMIDRWISGSYVGISDRIVKSFKLCFGIELTGHQSIMFIEDGKLKTSTD